ncbi:Ankyrin repeat-containing domain protein [Elaphomyces granulatus]
MSRLNGTINPEDDLRIYKYIVHLKILDRYWHSVSPLLASRSGTDEHAERSDAGILLGNVEEYQKAEDRLREAMECYKIEFGEERPHTLQSQYGLTPLSWASGNGYDTVVSLLLGNDGVDPDLNDGQYGRTPLSWAAGCGHEAVVKLLLETGRIEVNSKDNNDRTPLSGAAENGHEAVVKLLQSFSTS